MSSDKKVIDPRTRLSEGFVPGPMPHVSPKGDSAPPPPRLVPIIHPPSLCSQGPCVHYHEIKHLMDAATPMDATLRAHYQTLKTCYPHPGIEIPLNGAPVFECNRWRPEIDGPRDRLSDREEYQCSYNWERYQAELQQWRDLVAKSADVVPVVPEPSLPPLIDLSAPIPMPEVEHETLVALGLAPPSSDDSKDS
jgi:hypothetical protein